MDSEHDSSGAEPPQNVPTPLHHSLVDSRNPFLATTMTERDENFPSFEALWGGGLNQSAGSVLDHPSSSSSCNISIALSISARAALNEHNRHVARYGIDDSFALPSHPAHVETGPPMDPLDAEWDRLLSNASSVVNLSSMSSSQSVHSTDIPFDTNARMTCTTIHALDCSNVSQGIEGIEVIRADVSVSDYFNSSKVFALRTPERSLQVAHTVTTRGEQQNVSEYSEKSEVSDILSSKRIQQLLASAAVASSSSSSPTTGHFDQQDTTNENSFLLSNADVSRISTDGSDCNADISFNSFNPHVSAQSTSDPLLVWEDQSSQRERTNPSRSQRLPFINVGLSTSPNRRGSGLQFSPRRNRLPQSQRNSSSSSSHHGGTRVSRPKAAVSPPRPTPRSAVDSLSHSQTSHQQRSPTPNRQHSPNASFSSHPFDQEALAILELSPISKPRSTSFAKEADGEVDESDCDDSRHEMLGLSPISRQAAKSAMLMMKSGLDWKMARSRGNEYATSLSAVAPRRDIETSTNSSPPLIEVDNHRFEFNSSLESAVPSPTLVVYESRLDDGEDDVSPLYSSSSVKKNNSSNDTSHSQEATNRSDPKVTSLSSITPNSSSEHHVTTDLAEAPTRIVSPTHSAPPYRQRMSTSVTSLGEERKVFSVASETMNAWNANDRRRYRTVVPFRVFVSEPSDFPNEDDSFSTAHKQRQPRSISRHGDACSVPFEQRRWRRGERSVQSGPQ